MNPQYLGQSLITIDAAKQLGSHYIVTVGQAQLQSGFDFVDGAGQRPTSRRAMATP